MKMRNLFLLLLSFSGSNLQAAWTTKATLLGSVSGPSAATPYHASAVVQTDGNLFRILVSTTMLPVPDTGDNIRCSFTLEHSNLGTVGGEWTVYNNSTVATSWTIEDPSFEFAEGDTLSFSLTWQTTFGSPTYTYSTPDEYTFGAPGGGGPPSYGITFHLPDNTGSRAILYIATQNNGNLTLGSYTQLAGASAVDWYVGGLSSNGAIDLQEITGGFVSGNMPVSGAGNVSIIPPGTDLPATTYDTVSSGNIPTVETAPNTGATASTLVLFKPLPTPANSSGTISTVTPPSGTVTFPGQSTPSGTAAATKTDIEKIGNQITTAINNADGRAAGTSNSIVTALNNVIQSGNKTVDALDEIRAVLQSRPGGTDMTATNDLLSIGNANTASIKTAVETLATNDTERKTWETARKTEATNAASQNQSAALGKQTEAQSVMTGAIPVHGFTDPTLTEPSLFEITLPGRGAVSGDTVINLNPFNSWEGSGLITFVKAVLAVVVSGLFTWWAYQHLQQYVFFSSLLSPARGNTVAGSGGQVTSAIVAAWMTLVLVSLPTAISALWTAAPLLPSVSNINPFAGATDSYSQAALYLLYGFIPMATITTALTSMFVVQRGGLIVYFGTAAAIRWFIA